MKKHRRCGYQGIFRRQSCNPSQICRNGGQSFLARDVRYSLGKGDGLPIYAAIENVDLAQSLGDHMALVDAAESDDKGHALEVFTDHIHDGFDLQIEGFKGAV